MTEPTHPECPRCGYDVSGVVSTWATECPIEGTCTECGFGFEWADVLSPLRRVPKWFFETAQTGLVRSAISTSVRTLMPWHFWSAIRMFVPCRLGRLGMLSSVALLGAYLGGVLGVNLPNTVIMLRYGGGYQGWVRDWVEFYLVPSLTWFVEIDPASPLGYTTLAPRVGGIATIFPLLSAVFIPLGFLVLPTTLRAARVKFQHVIRAGMYGWIGVCVLIGLWWMVIGALDVAEDNGFVDTTAWDGVLEAIGFGWVVFFPVFWACACRKYLGIEQPVVSAIMLCFMGMLMSVLGAGVILATLESLGV